MLYVSLNHPLLNHFLVHAELIHEMETLRFLITGKGQLLGISAVGYSGVLFTYALLETYHSQVDTRSIFGFFSVPAKLYPW